MNAAAGDGLNALDRWLNEPQLSGLAVGSAEWFTTQRKLIADRPLVNGAYLGWYEKMLGDAASAPSGNGKILELGSGANFVKGLDPNVITSDVVRGASDLVVDARDLPFGDESLRAILLTHVFHHIPDVERFLNEAIRTLVPGGVISMIDVAHTPFAKFFFTHFHPEGYDDSSARWQLDESAPLGGANQAMTWIVFRRDVADFSARYPQLRIEVIEYLPWFAYLFSGGLTRRSLMPKGLVPLVRLLDVASRPLDRVMALHWHIRIRKNELKVT
jgi:SAM-dependent methyltransferase